MFFRGEDKEISILLFVLSKGKINFFDLATYFKSQGCLNALYLNGFVSRTYLKGRFLKIKKYGNVG